MLLVEKTELNSFSNTPNYKSSIIYAMKSRLWMPSPFFFSGSLLKAMAQFFNECEQLVQGTSMFTQKVTSFFKLYKVSVPTTFSVSFPKTPVLPAYYFPGTVLFCKLRLRSGLLTSVGVSIKDWRGSSDENASGQHLPGPFLLFFFFLDIIAMPTFTESKLTAIKPIFTVC